MTTDGYIRTNLAACIQLTDMTPAGAVCAADYQASTDCAFAACTSCDGETACLTAALAICTPDAGASACAIDQENGGSFETCSPGTVADTATYIANLMCGGTLVCPPASTTTYQPAAYVPAVGHQGVCTPADIAAWITACGDSGTMATCAPWQEANLGTSGTPCGNCIDAPNGNGAVWYGAGGTSNVAGCIQILDSAHGAACGAALDASLGCQYAACKNCPGTGPTDYGDCEIVAISSGGGCTSLNVAEESACSASGSFYDTCQPGGQGSDEALSYVTTLICGT